MKNNHDNDETLGLTSQAAVEAVGNRYDLILIASRRARELKRGDAKKVQCRKGTVLTALKEIESGHIGRNYLFKEQNLDTQRPRKPR